MSFLPFGEIRMTPAPAPCCLLDPSKNIVDAREVSVSFLVGYPKWKVRCSTAAVSLSENAKVLVFSRRTPRIDK